MTVSTVYAAQDIRKMPLDEVMAMNTSMYHQVDDDMRKQPDSYLTVSKSFDDEYKWIPANGYVGDPNIGIGPYSPPVSVPAVWPYKGNIEPEVDSIDALKKLLEEAKAKPSDFPVEALLAELEVRINKMPQGTNEEIQERLIAKQSLEMLRAFLVK